MALTHEVLPLLRQSPACRIVNLSSIVDSFVVQAQENSPSGMLSYNASKTALNMLPCCWQPGWPAPIKLNDYGL